MKLKVLSPLALSLALSGAGVRPALSQGDSALARLQAAAQTDSNDPVAHYELAEALVRARRGVDARRALETAILIDREFAPAYVLLGRLVQAERRPGVIRFQIADGAVEMVSLGRGTSLDSAARLFRRAFLLDPIVEIMPSTQVGLTVVWHEALTRGLQEYGRQRLDIAAPIFDSVILDSDRRHKDPPPLALWYHALCEARLSHFDPAIVDMERMLDHALRDSVIITEQTTRSVRYVLAALHQRAGHYEQAERLYRQVLEEDLSLDLAHVQLANLYQAQQRWPEAIMERRYALDIDSDNPTLLFDLGVTLLQAGETAEARSTLDQVTRLNPRESRAQYMLGLALARLGETQGSRAAFDRFLQLAPSRYGALIADARTRRAQLQ